MVKNVRRSLYFLKRPLNYKNGSDVSLRDVQQEVVKRLGAEFGIHRGVSCAPADPQLRYLVRGEKQRLSGDQPELLEVQIEALSGKCPPANWEGDTFERVFNTTTTALERILTQCGIKGPCWLDVSDAGEDIEFSLINTGLIVSLVSVKATTHLSHCQEEYVLDLEKVSGKLDVIQVAMAGQGAKPPPLISLVAMNILTAVNEKDKERQVCVHSLDA